MISKLLPYLFLAILVIGFGVLINGFSSYGETRHTHISSGAIIIAGATIALAIYKGGK